jgi:hypothetical protein
MVGAAFELFADHIDWVLGERGNGAAESLRGVVEGSKVLSFRLARRRPFDPAPALDTLATAWSEGMERLEHALK